MTVTFYREILLLILTLFLLNACGGGGTSTEQSGNGPAPPESKVVTGYGQVEVTSSPYSFTVETTASGSIELGLIAVNRLLNPSLNGSVVFSDLLTGASFLLSSDGTGYLSYADHFDRNYRGRRQAVPPGEEWEDIRHLAGGDHLPKILVDADVSSTDILVLNSKENAIGWSGTIVYTFNPGLPFKSFKFQSRDGKQKTTLSDTGAGIEVLGSVDGEHWTRLWQSPGPGEGISLDLNLPGSLLGAEKLYIAFRSEEAILNDFVVSGEVDASSLSGITNVENGINIFEYTDSEGSSHQALIYWKGDKVVPSQPEAPVPAYPSGSPVVNDSDTELTVLFPERTGITFLKSPEGGITGIGSLFANDRRLLNSLPGETGDLLSLVIFSEGEVGGITDWEAYLLERSSISGYCENLQWPEKGGRQRYEIPLSDATYKGASIQGETVYLTFEITDQGQKAEIILELRPANWTINGKSYKGLGWRINLTGLRNAAYLKVREPVYMVYGNWTFQQTWGSWYEYRADLSSAYAIPAKWYFADAQPYYLSAGPSGAMLGFLDDILASKVEISEDGGRHILNLEIPLGRGETRQTPFRLWLWSGVGTPDKWAAIDEWTSVYDSLSAYYHKIAGISETEPKPILWYTYWGDEHPPSGTPPMEESVFYRISQTELLNARDYGFGVFMLDGPWESDWEHPEGSYLPGSCSGHSLNAPWNLDLSRMLGGEEAFNILSRKADELGVDFIVWITPGHLSNSSPLFVEHPDWVRWRPEGIPEHAGYSDITGTRMESGWFEYAVSKIKTLAGISTFDGFLVDSWLTFGLYPDASGMNTQIIPSLQSSVLMQKRWREMGLDQIYIEGTGPFGVSSGGYGWELSFFGGDSETPWKKFETIRGREYGLYRYNADTMIESDSYYRALASKGIISVFSKSLFEQWSPDVVESIRQTNRDYMKVLPWMKHRHLIGSGDTWLGVEWISNSPDVRVLFSFTEFTYSLSPGSVVEDVTTGSVLDTEGALNTYPYHTYLIRNQ